MIKIIKKLCVLFVFVCSFIFMFVNIFYCYADSFFEIDNAKLYNETNTYNYLNSDLIDRDTYEIKDEYINDFSNKARYDLSKRNNVKVSNDYASITVFTHGFTGHYTDWLCNNSIVYKLADLLDANVFVIEVNDPTKEKKVSFEISKINGENTNIDFSKHVIILFEGFNTGYDNDYIYTQFNFMMSIILHEAKYSELNQNHVLPKVNLIGHSRGGLTNMQYALDHPDLVDNIYSFGTPYLGSSLPNLDRLCFNGDIGRLFLRISQRGEADISNEDAYGSYVKRWNEGYDTYYKNINLIALGASTSVSYLLPFISNMVESSSFIASFKNFCYENDISILYDALNFIIMSVISITAVSSAVISCDALTSFVAKTIAKIQAKIDFEAITNLVNDELVSKEVKENLSNVLNICRGFISAVEYLPTLLINEFGIDGNHLTWRSDVAVNLDSQLGKGKIGEQNISYKGIYSKYKIITEYDHSPTSLPHVLELADSELQNIILNDFKNRLNNENIWGYSFNDDNTITINGYYGSIENGILNIPAMLNINGVEYEVSKIGDSAFNPNSYSLLNNSNISNIKQIFIPSTIKRIGNKSFANLEELESVTFDNDSSLYEIGNFAFSETSIKHISLPNNLKRIESAAFENSQLTSIDIGNNINYLGASAFQYCDLKTVNSSSNYLNYTNGLLTKNYGKTLTYVNNSITELLIPSEVEIIDYNTFENTNIKKLDLNKVKIICNNAFLDSKLEEINGGDMLEDADISAFSNTPFFNNLEEKLVVGNVLLFDYIDEDIYYVDYGIKRIGHNSIYGNANKVVIPNSVESISNNAFTNVSNLKEVYFKSNRPPMVSHNSFNNDVKFIVPYEYYETYENNISYEDYEIETKTINISIYEDNNLLETMEYHYGELLENLPEKEHYDIASIKDVNGRLYRIGEIVFFTDDTILNIKYEETQYEFNFIVNEEIISEISTYQGKININIPTKRGFIFLGWYDQYGNLIIDNSNNCKWENVKDNEIFLNAKFITMQFNISYELNDAEVYGYLKKVFTFEKEGVIHYKDLPEVRKFGYEFLGWYIKGTPELFSTTYYYEHDICLEARFKGVELDLKNDEVYEEYAVANLKPKYTSFLLIFKISFKQTFNYVIKNSCKKIAFIGNESEIIMKIIIEPREDDLVMAFYNINAIGEKGCRLIDSSSSPNTKLLIEYRGTVSLKGGCGENGQSFTNVETEIPYGAPGINGKNGLNGSNGMSAIYASYISFFDYDSKSYITVIGGTGGNGGNGSDGQNGGAGIKAPSGSIFSPKKGDDGFKGGNGGNGGAGGNGAVAIETFTNDGIKVSNYETCRIVGGDGGNGGAGGSGGIGGTGASDESANPFNGVGDPGNGGQGGIGGAGGNGGNGAQGTNNVTVYSYKGTAGLGGAGGKGGQGGTGGKAGTLGGNGKDGVSGYAGIDGLDGNRGMDGSNQEGNNNSIINTNYSYNETYNRKKEYLDRKLNDILFEVDTIRI